MSYLDCRETLLRRIEEPAPGRIQLLSGPRQVGKTTLLVELADRLGKRAVYTAVDTPEALIPGFWEQLWARVEETASRQGGAVVLLDEVHLLPDWPGRLKSIWDRFRREKTPVHIVATGSSSLRIASGSRVKTGNFRASNVRGLLEFTRRHTAFRPLMICDEGGSTAALGTGIEVITYRKFLLDGPPR